MATGGSSSSSNVPTGGGAADSGSGKTPMKFVPVEAIECLRKRCKLMRVLIHVNDQRKAVVVLHGGEDGKPDHIMLQNVPAEDGSLQSTYSVDVSGWTPESQTEALDEWHATFRSDATGVFYDSNQNVIYGVPRGHPGGDMPRSLAIAPKKNEQGKAPAAAGSSSSADGPVLVVQAEKYCYPEQRKRIKAMTRKDLESYFHLTQKDAALIGLDIGTTALKNLCRANGLSNWPYRKIACLDNKFNNNLKKKITGWSLSKAIQGVTKAFELRNKKIELYESIMSSMPEQLQAQTNQGNDEKGLESYLHITQKDVALIGLGIGTTVLKNLCRANGLSNWPYRKIACLDSKFNNNLKKKITLGGGLPKQSSA
uniref:RWP-RK domain-containing protein n=1 Tax=Leersia perrieri TaxID=77586 RepID=A0A0D9XE86_9ORYZ